MDQERHGLAGRGAAHAVAEAERHHAGDAGILHAVVRADGDVLAGGMVGDMDEPRLDGRQHRPQLARRCHIRGDRRQPVEQVSHAHGVADVGHPREQAGAGPYLRHRRLDAAGGEPRQQRRERVILLARPVAAGHAAERQMGVDAFDHEVGEGGNGPDQVFGFRQRHAEPAESAVDLDVDGGRAARRRADGLGAGAIIDRRRQVMLQQLGNIHRQVAAEQQEARADAGGAHRPRLVDAAGPQRFHAKARQFPADRHGAVAIGVGLDRGDQPPLPGQPAHDGQVVRERVEIEFRPQGAQGFASRCHAHSIRIAPPMMPQRTVARQRIDLG